MFARQYMTTLLLANTGTNYTPMSGTWPLSTSAHPAPLLLRQRWAVRFRPALVFFHAITAGLLCVKLALMIAHRGMTLAFVLLWGVLGLLSFGSYWLATMHRRRQTLLLDGQGITLRRGRTEQRCEWREVTALRRTDETAQFTVITSRPRLYIERGATPAIALDDEWTVPLLGLLQRLSERQQAATGRSVPIYGDVPRPL
jgi:hypothetical protein